MADVRTETGPGQDWQNRAMPIFESSKVALQQLLRRADRVRPADVAEVVENDPLLLLQALRFINRRERSSLSVDVVSVENIVMLTGVEPFIERFRTLPSVESLLLPDAPERYAAFLQQVFLSRLTAKLALTYADWRYDARMDEILAAATLSRCHALLALLDPQQPATDPAHLSAQLGLPEGIVRLLGPAEDAPLRVALQRAVARLVEAFQSGWWTEMVQQQLAMIAGILDAEPGAVWDVLCKNALAFARDPKRWPQVEQPARWLPMLPGEWPKSVMAKPAPESKSDPLVMHLHALMQASRGTPVKEVMALAMRALAEGLGMRRIVFSLLAQGQPELRARYVFGVPPQDPLRQLVIRLDQPNLFGKLMQKSQGVWYNADSAAQLGPHLPAAFRAGFRSDSFCAMSIFIGSKPIGLIVADRNGAGALSERHYRNFKQICLLTSQALTQSAAR